MFTRSRVLVAFSFLMIAAFALSACQPVTTTVEVVKTVEVPVQTTVEVVKTQEVQVIQTQVVEVEKKAFTTPHPALGDLKVRQALAYCTNKIELIQSVYPLLKPEEQQALVMESFIPNTSWAYAGDSNITIYPFDPEKGKALFDEAGWTLQPNADYRTDAAGDQLSLKFTTTTAAFRQTWGAVFVNQMAACGVEIIPLYAPASWWFGDTTGLQHRDFELGAYAWVGQADPAGQTLYACDQIPVPDNNWQGQNYPGWCDQDADKAIKLANNSLSQQVRAENYAIVQKKFTEQVPTIPLFNRTNTYAIAADFQNFSPAQGTSYYMWNAYDWEIPGKDTIVLGWTQEPASLFGLVESALVANQAASFIYGSDTTQHDFSFQAQLLQELATIDNGDATNTAVDVKAGDKIIDADGNPVELADGTMIKDENGDTVAFDGSQKMMQLVVTYKWVDGLVWSDGEPLKAEDFELAYKINCDPDSGATSFITCDNIQSYDVQDDKTVQVTWKPGSQSPTYFLSPWGLDSAFSSFYPAHRVLSDGRKLADVPAKEWTTLKEIAEDPIGVGPYVLKEWTKGEKMVFEANPYYTINPVKTKNLVISFVDPSNAEAQLLGGQVDVLDDTTLTGLDETLVKAEADGKIKTFSLPSGTWEHIDINMFLR
jgi:ABC-type transport system substrate-binding protein